MKRLKVLAEYTVYVVIMFIVAFMWAWELTR